MWHACGKQEIHTHIFAWNTYREGVTWRPGHIPEDIIKLDLRVTVYKDVDLIKNSISGFCYHGYKISGSHTTSDDEPSNQPYWMFPQLFSNTELRWEHGRWWWHIWKHYPRIWLERLSKTMEDFSWDNPYTRQDFKYELKHSLLHHLILTNPRTVEGN